MFCVVIRGVVQGVGFRPFIYDLALRMHLKGEVYNDGYGVSILLDTDNKKKLDLFVQKIREKKPPLSEIDSIQITKIKNKKIFNGFSIARSADTKTLSSPIPADIAMCKACERELCDASNERFEYPFITCTDCGPRYSIVKKLPYDRENTSMQAFNMCKRCEAEYNDPKNRRYHAESIGCHDCGPSLTLFDSSGEKRASLSSIDEIAALILKGKIIALKGVGGYHLICDATSDKALKLLRERKKRPLKPFGVMVKDIKRAKDIAYINAQEEDLLCSNRRPIVLVKKRKKEILSEYIAPAIDQIGLFLAYTPLHYLLLQKLNTPLVATSANISGEPLCKDLDAIMRLRGVWDYCLDHNREILNSCDDSVAFVENKKIFMLRNARGFAPKYIKLPCKTDKKILALGANQKSSVAISVGDNIILSPYIGDLGSLSSIKHFKAHIETLKRIYDFEPDAVVCDKHPNYESSRYAQELKRKNKGIELFKVQHHHAHILATMGINSLSSKVLGVSFDGTGYGDDSNLWGGEFLLCDGLSYERAGYFKYFKLLGAEKAIKEPRRVALSFLFELYGKDALRLGNPTIDSFHASELQTLYIAWKKGLNAPLSSSCGRLFDAVASLLNVVQICGYEGESGLLLETLYDENISGHYGFSIEEGIIDFAPIFEQISTQEDTRTAVSKFFHTIVEIIYTMHKNYNLPLVLSGGVFQNRVLLRLVMQRIPEAFVAETFISNDAAIAYGQAVAAALKFKTS